VADVPYPINATDPAQAIKQMKQLMDELFQERLAGATVGDVFQVGADDVLTLREGVGLEKASSTLAVKPKTSGGVLVDANGVAVQPSPDKGLALEAAGLYVKLKASYGIAVDADGLKLKKQLAEADAGAVSAISVGAGIDTIALATFNTALTGLVTEINSIKTTLNNVIAKLEAAEVLTA
jgi:hypothetical protein